LLNCLELLRKQQRKPAMKRMFEHLTKSVSGGMSLSEAMGEHKEVFSPLYLSMIRVGETGGILEQTSLQLSLILGREEKVKANMKTAAAYPIFLLGLGMISATVIVTFMLPKILGTMDTGTASLPAPTRVLMDISQSLRSLFTSIGGWVVLAGIVAGLCGLRRWTKTVGRASWDAFRLKIPVLGPVLRTIAVGRFTRTLGALTKGGVTILEALAVVRDTLGNEVLAREVDMVAEKVKRGENLADPLEQSGRFPPLLIQIVAIGEQTGKLDELLLNAADTFDSEADGAINRFMAIFPAVLILLLALVIGFIIAAALLPIVTMSVGTAGH
jgi:type II secretory pathway component PulF